MQPSRRILVGLTLAIVLGACSNDGLRQLRSDSDGPDEFLVSPVKPLEQPENLSDLPPPTPGAGNRVDLRPLDDAAVALGGRPARSGGSVPSSDGALVSHASRFGVEPAIRQSLADADSEFRERRGRFTQFRIVPVDRYDQVYRHEAIDPFEETRRFRRAGIRTPASPPSD